MPMQYKNLYLVAHFYIKKNSGFVIVYTNIETNIQYDMISE